MCIHVLMFLFVCACTYNIAISISITFNTSCAIGTLGQLSHAALKTVSFIIKGKTPDESHSMLLYTSGNVYPQEGLDHELVVIQTSSSTTPLLLYLLLCLYMPHPTPSPPSLHHIYLETQLYNLLHMLLHLCSLACHPATSQQKVLYTFHFS